MPVPNRPVTPLSPTGTQWVIGHGGQQLCITEVGATMRSYTVDGRDVIDGFSEREWSTGGRGQVLAPWPNRLGDGLYEFFGVTAQAALNEPSLRNAIHGLVRWVPWQIERLAQNVINAGCVVHPTPGYPYVLELRIEYRLGRDGLTVSTTATNRGDAILPFGIGFHPYLSVGQPIESAILRLPATRRLVLDERSLPTGELEPLAGSEFDFTSGRPVGTTSMDTALTGLHRDADGIAWASLDDPNGLGGAELWVDDRYNYLMCYTGDTLSDPKRRRRSVAIEPMTCPPDAFRSRKDLIILEPGHRWHGTWGLRPR